MTDVIRDLHRRAAPRASGLHGAGSLSNAELLAILLGSGTAAKTRSSSRASCSRGGRLARLNDRDVGDRIEHPRHRHGEGDAHRRRVRDVAPARMRDLPRRAGAAAVSSSRTSGTNLVRTMGGHRQERLGAAVLDSHHRILDQREIFIGTINNALVSTRDIVGFAILTTRVGVVLYHNHPSGDRAAEQEDIDFTRKIKQSLAAAVDIELVDHIIDRQAPFTSMKSEA